MSRDNVPQDFQLPQGNAGKGFSKIEAWANTFRILSDPTIGYKYRTKKGAKEGKESTALWVREEKDIPWEDVIEGEYWPQCSYTWAFVVRDYQKNDLSILEISKKKILEQLLNQRKSKGFGDPTTYDITITKSGVKKDTKYVLTVSAPEPITQEIDDALAETPVDLDRLFTDGKIYEVDTLAKSLARSEDVNFADEPTQAPTVNSDLPY